MAASNINPSVNILKAGIFKEFSFRQCVCPQFLVQSAWCNLRVEKQGFQTDMTVHDHPGHSHGAVGLQQEPIDMRIECDGN